MLSILFKLFSVFGGMPWLERFVGLGFDKNILNNLTNDLQHVTGHNDLNEAIKLIQDNKSLELELQRALLIAETNYWEQCIKDRQNARERDLMIQNLKGSNVRANIMLIMAILGIFFSIGALIIFRSILHADGVGILAAVAGVFGACLFFQNMYIFYFTSINFLKN